MWPYITVYTLIAVMVGLFIYAVKKGVRQAEAHAEAEMMQLYQVQCQPEPQEPPLKHPFDSEPWLSMYLDGLAYLEHLADSLGGDTDPRRPIVG